MIDSEQNVADADYPEKDGSAENPQEYPGKLKRFTKFIAIFFVVLLFIFVLLAMALGSLQNGGGLLNALIDSGQSVWVWLVRYGLYASVWFLLPQYLRSHGISNDVIRQVKRPIVVSMAACELMVIVNLIT